MKRIKIIYGPKSFFKAILKKEGLESNEYKNLSQLVQELSINEHVFMSEQSDEYDLIKKATILRPIQNFVIESGEYSSANEHVLINTQILFARYNIGNMFIHNPPDAFKKNITNLFNPTIIEEEIYDYQSILEDSIRLIDAEFDKTILGQNEAKMRILVSLIRLFSDDKPVVLLFYGPSGVGKTETAKLLARLLEGAENTLFRRQLSMFQNDHFASYLFGGSHSEKSFARELLERSSNVLLMDEFDKVNPGFHNAFYQLFDEGVYVDSNYTVNMRKSIIICTSNYSSEESARAKLGDPIYSRFDACIGFNNLTSDVKELIVERVVVEELNKLPETVRSKVNVAKVKAFSHDVAKSNGNYRTIRNYIRDLVSMYRLKDIVANTAKEV